MALWRRRRRRRDLPVREVSGLAEHGAFEGVGFELQQYPLRSWTVPLALAAAVLAVATMGAAFMGVFVIFGPLALAQAFRRDVRLRIHPQGVEVDGWLGGMPTPKARSLRHPVTLAYAPSGLLGGRHRRRGEAGVRLWRIQLSDEDGNEVVIPALACEEVELQRVADSLGAMQRQLELREGLGEDEIPRELHAQVLRAREPER